MHRYTSAGAKRRTLTAVAAVVIAAGAALCAPSVTVAGSSDDAHAVVDHYADGVGGVMMGNPRRSDRRNAGGGQAGVAGGPRRLRAHRGVPLLRRADRQRDGRAGGSDQRLAARRGLHRLRRGRRRGRHRQRPGRLPDDRCRAAQPRSTSRAARANISTGWHAIEFLLWGQDLSADGPGERPVTDYTTANQRRPPGDLPDARQRPAARASQRAWSTPGRPMPTTTARRSSPRTRRGARPMISPGIGELTRGELAGERMTVA